MGNYSLRRDVATPLADPDRRQPLARRAPRAFLARHPGAAPGAGTRLVSALRRAAALMATAALLTAPAASAEAPGIVVGSKRFTESYILGEVLRQRAEQAGEARAVHRAGLGNTAVVFGALRSGAIDVYVDYTGTLAREILGREDSPGIEEIDKALAPAGMGAGIALGFENTYALAMDAGRARALGVSGISQLARHPDLVFGLSQEFLARRDGWPGLSRVYGLAGARVRGLDHGLGYQALADAHVDVTDVYTTDAKIARYGLRLLEDDRLFFPGYGAVLVYRRDLPQRLPRTWAALRQLEGAIDVTAMRRMNARVELDRLTFAQAAAEFLETPGEASGHTPARNRDLAGHLLGPDLPRLLAEHAALVFGALALSAAVGVPLGALCHRRQAWAGPVLGLAGVIQTIPSLALLALLIAATGQIGAIPALAALFLYGLLPIVRNTYTGLQEVPSGLRQAAAALGLGSAHILTRVEIPLALPTALAGVRTSAVINVGTATIAAFVGAGGLGDRIVAGLALNDHRLLLAGALPAAALALAVEALFAVMQRRLDWRRRIGGRRAPSSR
jgi:osmoprotectant transport system permease protein